ALHHNMRPTSLIQHCRHALAIDEHRSGFSHTPLRAFIPHATGEEWETNRARWAARIEQRWFVGAHSNIGGGYENNELAQRPFAWMLEGARQAGLVCETPPAFPPAQPEALPRDSYVEFATPFWSSLFRSKRYYRAVDPEPEFRASRRKERGRERGFSLVPINEVIDSTAFAFWSRPGITPPPQVVAYARRRHDDPATPPALREQLRKLADPAQTPPNPWLGDEMLPHAIVVFWAAFAAAGVVTLAHVVTVGEWRAPMWLLALAAFSLVIVDRVESRMNFMLALGAASARTRAYYDGIYWTRALGVILFFAGVLGAARHLWMAGWRIPTPDLLDDRLLSLLFKWWPVAAAAAAGGIAANALDGGRGAGRRMAGALLGAAGTVALAGLMLALAWCGARMVAPVFGSSPADPLPPPTHAGLAGFLLLLQFALGWLLGGLAWVSEPLARANLGSINMLQRRASPAAVAGLFRNWIELLSRPWVRPDEKAAGQVRQRISETLWRDIHGYIPTYLVVLHFGLWFASGKLGWKWLLETSGGVWFMLPTIAAAANVIEDAFYVWFANYHTSSPAEQAARRAPNAAHTLVAFAMTWVKNVAFAAAVLLSAAAILHGSWLIVHLHEATGWRGTVALAVTIVTLVAGVALAVGAVYYRWVTAHKIRREPRDRHAPA
ncbi:MAG: DUF2235 domain-containing protein, partial [Verrucomicrobia bacterium]|nr:DUF2235 domain-containing protein [Verrucomicrobiota bacterium]